MPRMAIRRYPWSPIFYGPLPTPLTRLLSSMEGIWCQDGNTLLSVSCTLTEGKIKFYIVAEAGLKMFRSSCLLAMDFKTGSPSVMEVFGLFIRLAVWDVLRADDTDGSHQCLVSTRFTVLGNIFPKDNCQKLHCGGCWIWHEVYLDRIISYLKGHFEYQKTYFPTYSWYLAVRIGSVLFGGIIRSTLAVVLKTGFFSYFRKKCTYCIHRLGMSEVSNVKTTCFLLYESKM